MIEYPKVRRYSTVRKIKEILKDTDVIEVSEKIDGANASFCIDLTKREGIVGFSREKRVTEKDNLNGFYTFIVEEIIKNKRYLNENYVYFGEWLTEHKIKYNESCYNKFYLFDIYDKKEKRWLTPMEKQKEMRYSLVFIKSLIAVPSAIITYSEFNRDYEIIKKVQDRMLYRINDNPEGFVFKVYDKTYKDEPLFFKIVDPKFEEVKLTPKNMSDDIALMETICTENRVSKIILKLLDNNTITDEELDVENMFNLMNIVIPKVIEDILEEEIEIIEEWKTEGLILEDRVIKTIRKITPKYIIKFIEGLD